MKPIVWAVGWTEIKTHLFLFLREIKRNASIKSQNRLFSPLTIRAIIIYTVCLWDNIIEGIEGSLVFITTGKSR